MIEFFLFLAIMGFLFYFMEIQPARASDAEWTRVCLARAANAAAKGDAIRAEMWRVKSVE